MTAAAMAVKAARANVTRIKTGIANAEASSVATREAIERSRLAATTRARAEALGDPTGDDEPVGQVADLTARLAGYEEAVRILRAQFPAAQAATESAEGTLRSELASHVWGTVVPPLLAAAQEAGATFGRAIASLAAAEDAALHLQRPPGEGYVTGEAGTLMCAMTASTSIGRFCDAGAARSALDWPGYDETAQRIDDELREMSA